MRAVNPIYCVLIFLFSLNCYAVDIFQLADCSDPDEVRIMGMLRRGESGINDQDPRTGDTLLHIAARWNHAGLLSALIARGASLTIRNGVGLTPYETYATLPAQDPETTFLLQARETQAEGPEPLFEMPRAPLLLNEVLVAAHEPRVARRPVVPCVVCMQDLSAEEMRRLGCGHEDVCAGCLDDQLVVALETNWRDARRLLRCPHAACGYEMNQEDVRVVTRDEARVALYDHVMLQLFIDSDPNMRRCPTPGCEAAYMINNARRPQSIQCPSCVQSYCSHCRTVHVEDRPCASPNAIVQNDNNAPAAREGQPADEETRAWILANTKPCPQCGKSIEKNGGCLHMTCSRELTGCGYEFCWACQRRWGRDTHPDFFECNLPPAPSWRLWGMFARFGQTPYMRYLRDHRWLQFTLAGLSLAVSISTFYNRYRKK